MIRLALSMIVVAAVLSGCGVLPLSVSKGQDGTQPPIGGPTSFGGFQNKKTFYYTGKEQTFIVPAGVTQLTVIAHGGEGAGSTIYPNTNTPGFPGRVDATIRVHPSDTLFVFVGGSGKHGGFNGGGAGGGSGSTRSGNQPYPGGGASDVRSGGDALADRIIVAAGGGGAGEALYAYGSAYGGNGGGVDGVAGGGAGPYGDGSGGAGGTKSGGGAGGAGGIDCDFHQGGNGQPGSEGSLGYGGDGGNGAQYAYAGGGGGGGGGYYGGGGGGGGAAIAYCYYVDQGGGGGGGSSYVEPSAIKSQMWTGWKANGDGRITFEWN